MDYVDQLQSLYMAKQRQRTINKPNIMELERQH